MQMPEDISNTPAASAVPETGATPEHATQPDDGSYTSAPEGASNQPPTKAPFTGKPEINYQKRYEDLHRDYTRRTQHEKEVMTRLQVMEESFQKQAELLAKATEEPFNPETFKQSWETQGPKALDSYYQKREQALRQEYDKRLTEQSQQSKATEIKLTLAMRRGDEESYPNFHDLEPVMNEIAASEDCPVDLSRPIDDVLDALYKLARESHSVDAIKAAEGIGAKNKEKELAKEAATAVAGGGKHQGVTSPDFAKLSSEKMREQLVSKYGVAED